MQVLINRQGNINIPYTILNELGIGFNSHLLLSIKEGGILLQPVSSKSICLNEKGLAKLDEARKSGPGLLPNWFKEEVENARNNI